jgi:hypothetical protein
MGKVSLIEASGDEKVLLLGAEFRNINVLDFEVDGGVIFTRIIFDGQAITLIGDPQEALKTHFGGRADQRAQ